MLAPKQPPSPVRLVTLDALGTIVALEPPWEHLARILGSPCDERLVAAVRTEMAYYRDHSHEGRDGPTLAALRGRCAAILSERLGRPVDVETMMAAIRFRPYPDAAPALQALRSRGLRIVCVSNWDCSLPDVLDRCGLLAALDGVVTSASAGARKPAPEIFTPALELAGCSPAEALHVGDTDAEDTAGARAAGMHALLIDRDGGGDVASLAEIEGRLESMRG